MMEVITLADGRTIREWTIHCPSCGQPVSVAGDDPVACPACHAEVRPGGVPTAALRTKARALDDTDSLVGQSLGKWRPVRLIGRGGMGRVYEAEQEGRGKRRVALKVLSEDLASDPAFVKRFQREARLLSGLSHPHVVQVLEQGETDGRLWFAMEYVRGENLRRRIEKGPLPAREAGRIASEIASALSYAHEKGVIHRDLKPENVLLDEAGTVHLVDFGLSRLVSRGLTEASTRLTRTDVIMGTYEYMSPEQRRGDRELDARADVFALGVILYEMLTGALPVGRFAAPSRTSRGIPAAFDSLVDRALAPKRDDRVPSARAFQEDIGKALAKPAPPLQPPPVPVARADVNEARGTLRHIDILATVDKVVGLIALLVGFGVQIPIAMGTSFLVVIPGIALVIMGFLLMRLGGRLSRMEDGSREAQMVASGIMLFFPPFLTIAGVYGLIVLTTDKARLAFRVGREPLASSDRPSVIQRRVINLSSPSHPNRASFLLRAFHFAAILWSLYVGFVALETLLIDPDANFLSHVENSYYESIEYALVIRNITIVAAGVAVLVMLRMFAVRRRQRGLGLAVIAFLFLASAAAFVTVAHDSQFRASTSSMPRRVYFGAIEQRHEPAPRLAQSLNPSPPSTETVT